MDPGVVTCHKRRRHNLNVSSVSKIQLLFLSWPVTQNAKFVMDHTIGIHPEIQQCRGRLWEGRMSGVCTVDSCFLHSGGNDCGWVSDKTKWNILSADILFYILQDIVP
jgi:hypothetical protein